MTEKINSILSMPYKSEIVKSDCLLASFSEGMPKVILEATACGTRVIATATGGANEIISRPDAGELIDRQDTPASIDVLVKVCVRKPDRIATRKYAETFVWATG